MVIKVMFCVLSLSVRMFPCPRKIELIFFLGVPDFPGCREIWKFLARLNYCSYRYVLSFLWVLLIAAAISRFLSLDGLLAKLHLGRSKILHTLAIVLQFLHSSLWYSPLIYITSSPFSIAAEWEIEKKETEPPRFIVAKEWKCGMAAKESAITLRTRKSTRFGKNDPTRGNKSRSIEYEQWWLKLAIDVSSFNQCCRSFQKPILLFWLTAVFTSSPACVACIVTM